MTWYIWNFLDWNKKSKLQTNNSYSYCHSVSHSFMPSSLALHIDITWCGRKVIRLVTLCTNQKHCCLLLHMAVRLTPAIDSVQGWTCYSCYVLVESVWSEVVFVRCVTKMDPQKFKQHCAIKFSVKLGESATVVPKNLTTEQKANWRDVCLDLVAHLERKPEFFSHVITDDESWILEYDLETKRQIQEWQTANSPCPKKARMSKSKINSMLICFFDSQGIVHKECVPPGQTLNQTF